jgi:hypothetical protein
METGLFPDETMALRLASNTIKKSMEAIIIPVIVARVYLRKLFIFKNFSEMNFKYINKQNETAKVYMYLILLIT